MSKCSCIYSAIVCDLQYLYSILALYMLEMFTFFDVLLYCVPTRLPCPHTHSRWVSLLHLIISDQCHTIPSLENQRKRFLFVPPSVGTFSSEWKSFCILASLGFANPLSIHVMSFLIFSSAQYIAKTFLLFSVARNPSLPLSSNRTQSQKKRLSKSVLMI